MRIEKEVLVICSVCKKIRINDRTDLWLKKEDDPRLYNELYNQFRSRISHSFCPEDGDKRLKEYKNFLF